MTPPSTLQGENQPLRLNRSTNPRRLHELRHGSIRSTRRSSKDTQRPASCFGRSTHRSRWPNEPSTDDTPSPIQHKHYGDGC
ncbi:hypothetical protein F2Q69_00031030 [Brassica cretica]|uniref:Uncharacterized protein n=1 Tax=Brassica cretica TaxID=69181 RepID=A0A8S9RYH4_BRACR|nr:hypothetical protein F2Q69_00031030 [Brassica cretica]